MRCGFFWDERCFWHDGGAYAGTLPTGELVEPNVTGLMEGPAAKRRLRNLMEVTGLAGDVIQSGAPAATRAELEAVHPSSYLDEFEELSKGRGGEIGMQAPFGPGGYDIARRSAGLAREAVVQVLEGRLDRAYALCRPPGHHALPEHPNGFCLLSNIGIAIRAAQARGLCRRVAVVDWDVHHGNGTEAIFYDDPDVLTISLHQDRNYPEDTGDFTDRGAGAARGANLNIPLPPGTGEANYLEAIDRIVGPALRRFGPEIIIIASGYDASGIDPLGRMLLSAESYRAMTERMVDLAAGICEGRLVAVHEGGYSEIHAPFCAHAVVEVLAESRITAPDPLAESIAQRQPSARLRSTISEIIGEMADALDQGA